MQAPATPLNEAQRLKALYDLNILDTVSEERFDRLTRMAKLFCQVPIALISLIDVNRQWFKSKQGLDAPETGRDVSFCGHAILQSDIFSIPNALLDPRFADNPLVVGAPNVIAYTGAPLILSTGECVGTLCLIDHVPRQFTQEQLQVVRDLAAIAQQELELKAVIERANAFYESESRLHAVIDNIDSGIITIDDAGMIENINPIIEHWFGYSRLELINTPISQLVVEAHIFEKIAILASTTHTIMLSARRKNGSIFPIEFSIKAMKIGEQVLFTGFIRDISAFKSVEESLKEANSQNQAILDNANYSIISTDTKGLILTFNKGAERMLGYRAQEIVQKTSLTYFHEISEINARASLLSAELNRPVAAGVEVLIAKARLGLAEETEWLYRHKDGHLITVLLTVTAQKNQQGDFIGFLGIASDITERKRIEKMKSEFISTVSHELRTPLTSIRGALGLVLGKASAGMTDKARMLIETASRNSERLTLLINDILDLEKIQSGHLAFNMQPVDLVTIAEQALVSNEGYALQHHVTLVISQTLSTASIMGDEHRLLQVFSNLISNAVKYSYAEGIVEIIIKHTQDGFIVSIKDQGQGIPEQFRAHIFNRFAQADSSDARAKGGTGLGLSITKAIIERHGGSLAYHTQEGQGTEFYFQLPEWLEIRTTVDDSRPKILICEDNTDAATVLSQLLLQEGISSDIVGTGSAAKLLLARTSYRALLLDLTLPDIDGLTLISELRADKKFQHLPIIVVSGRAEEGQQVHADEAVNVVDWLQKPVVHERLLRALNHVLAHKNQPTILHVEDDATMIASTRALVSPIANYYHATTLVQARALLTQQFFDMVMVDIILPDGSGLDLLKEISVNTQVLILSASEPHRELAEQATAVLMKSRTNSSSLLATIKEIINVA